MPSTPPSISAAEAAGGATGEAGGSAVASAAPNMIGDFGIGAAAALHGVSNSFRVPLVTRGGIKISENESPRPVDRVFFTYNYFNDATIFAGAGNTGGASFNLHREMFGFEKTCLDGNASFGVRLPFMQRDGFQGQGVSFDGFGDLTAIFKYAFVNDCRSGDVLSGGLVATFPTGRDIVLADGHHLNSILLQPWVGGICNFDRVYTIAFTGVIVPTDERDVTFYFGDIGLGYRLFQACDANAVLTQVTPTVEFHANIPMNHNGSNNSGLIVFPDQYIVTGGVHIGLCNTAFLTVGVATPMAGPKPYNYEILAQFNFRF
jgi:hypothetical protein